MKTHYFIFILFFCFWVNGQETFTPLKTENSQIVLDGKLTEGEWDNAAQIPLDIEFSPANNLPARKETIGYITYSDSYIYIAVYAK
jgi:hypothetical protein